MGRVASDQSTPETDVYTISSLPALATPHERVPCIKAEREDGCARRAKCGEKYLSEQRRWLAITK